jgi:hypothetical protein
MKPLTQKTVRIIALLSLLYLSDGCISNKPPANSEFAYIKNIKELNGLYKNRGRGERTPEEEDRLKIHPVFLSALIWRNPNEMDHKSIEKIKIKQKDDDTLVIQAIKKDGTIFKEKELTKGKDFKISSGRIDLYWGVTEASPAKTLGIIYGYASTGIDTDNNGKFKTGGTMVGLVACLIPMIVSGTEEYRFDRIE